MNSKDVKKIIPIILAGGTGSRLWPLSRKSFPKQFLNLLEDEYTMLQTTYKRIENIDEDKVYLIINTLNQLDADIIRNKLLLKVLPLKV